MHEALLAVSVDFVFFFQAEDGIRDIGVTGVQTCALPISASAASWWGARRRAGSSRWGAAHCCSLAPQAACAANPDSLTSPGSEERRVGKEGRYRGSPYH